MPGQSLAEQSFEQCHDRLGQNVSVLLGLFLGCNDNVAINTLIMLGTHGHIHLPAVHDWGICDLLAR